MKKDPEMATIRCDKCPNIAEEIINAEALLRVGWWCRACGYFKKSILRERKVR
jgi:uncharacterized Zn finger protein